MAVTDCFCDFTPKKGGVGIVVPGVAFWLGSGTVPAGHWCNYTGINGLVIYIRSSQLVLLAYDDIIHTSTTRKPIFSIGPSHYTCL